MLIRKWNSLGVQEKLHILIQGTLIVIFVLSTLWVIKRFEAQVTASVEARAVDTADGLINGMNMMMLNGTISDPENRKLFLNKMAQSKGIRELRIIRAQQVSDQFGPGLPEEQALDNIDHQVVASGNTMFLRGEENGVSTLRVVVPFIAQENFRGTNCLNCHHVKPGSVNGAASVTMDLTEDEEKIAEVERALWWGQLALQVLLSIIISLFVRILIVKNIAMPVKKLQMAMSDIQKSGDLSKRAEVDERNGDIGEMAHSFNVLLASLQDANKRLDLFAQVFGNSGEAIIITDAERSIIAINPAFTQITGYEREEVIGRNPRLLSSGRQTPEFYREMWRAINETGRWQGEIWNRRKNGEIYPEWLSIGTVRDEKDEVVNYISIFNDITHRKESERHIQFLAHYDSLTKLPNRALFDDRLRQALAAAKRSGRKKVALLFLDLDRFKSINDSLGHLAGDQLLQSVAGRLKSSVREMDTVCRQGGDEFMVLLTEIERAEDAAHVATKIVEAMAEPHIIGEQQLMVTFSIGISLYPDDATDITSMIKNADAAMYHAKEKGRNNFQFFTADMNAEAAELLEMEIDLRRAVQQKEFELHYQPQIDNRSGRIIGMESLIRWRHPVRGMVSPGRFIPVAEDCGLITQIGEWGLREACFQNKKWQEAGLLRVPVAVNISALQFHQKNFRETVARALHDSGLAPGYLELEITEGITIKDVESTVILLNELKLMGVLISIDDFGTGYSSLSYLKRFPIDKLKIDQSFVRDITTDASDAAIVQTIIRMGHGLGLKVIAEGAETAEQIVFLKEHRCDEIQGYYFSKPLPAEDFANFVRSCAV